jgi:hypothetical protein
MALRITKRTVDQLTARNRDAVVWDTEVRDLASAAVRQAPSTTCSRCASVIDNDNDWATWVTVDARQCAK